MQKFLLAIDQGTTSTRAILFDQTTQIINQQQIVLKQYFPASGWVEHDPEEIWQAVLTCCRAAITQANITPKDIAGIGITNQRETTIVWDRKTGQPIHPAIVWQDRRTSDYCKSLTQTGHARLIQAKTGLLIDPYFSAAKIAWLLDHVPGAREKANKGELAFGTIDCFLLWRLTAGEQHATDATNASRTMLFNIHQQQWDEELLKLFNIPISLLPQVLDNTANFGETHPNLFGTQINIAAMAGDQQAALVGQACFQSGMVKSTYGTGAFLMLNTGNQSLSSKNRLLTTVAYRLNGQVTYALEGSIFSAGSIVQWLRDKLGLIKTADETETLAAYLPSNGGVYFVPAFTGLGAPYWDANVRATIMGLTRDSGREYIVRAGLEAVAYQTCDLFNAMKADGAHIAEIRVDGGMVANNWLMQFLTDMLQLPVERALIPESTALGVAYLAGLQMGIFQSLQQISSIWHFDRQFKPGMSSEQAEILYAKWQMAVRQVLT